MTVFDIKLILKLQSPIICLGKFLQYLGQPFWVYSFNITIQVFLHYFHITINVLFTRIIIFYVLIQLTAM